MDVSNPDLLVVDDLRMQIDSPRGVIRAVDGISLHVRAGEAVAIVGESGSGKTLTARSILRLLPGRGRITAGQVLFRGRDLVRLSESDMRAVRGAEIAAIFQDPMSYLNPVMRIGDQITEVLRFHQRIGRQQAYRQAIALLRQVHIPAPERVARSYPHQLSGGMRQRVLIATAISCRPALLIADEPTTALDVTVQAQIMRLLEQLRVELGSALLLITHDLGIVVESCDRVYVMYGGELVEHGEVASLAQRPRHPYTQGLFAANFIAENRVDRFATIDGQVPDLAAPPTGCRFHPRCPHVMDRCRTQAPPIFAIGGGAWARCWLHEHG